VVEEGKNAVGSGFYSRVSRLDIQQCVDIKVVNIYENREELEACIAVAK